MRLVSVVVPDWLMAITSVSVMSDRSPNPESSVAGREETPMPVPASSASIAAATASPAIAAVPWPMTITFEKRPEARSDRIESDIASDATETVRPSGPSSSRPRSVDRTDSGDSPISFRK